MQGLVSSVKAGGVHQPALVRPCEGGGYEIIAGHRRQRASELAGYRNMPCIVRNMTDDEAVCIMKDMTRWGRDYLQVGNAMEVFRRNNVRFIAVNNGIDSEKPETLEFAPFINIMSEWYARDIRPRFISSTRGKGI